MAIPNTAVASVEYDEDSESQCDILDREHYDPVNCEYNIDECAEMFNPEYDKEWLHIRRVLSYYFIK